MADPYGWLENDDVAEVVAWTEAQDRLSRRYLDGMPGRAALSSQLRELLILSWIGTPHVRGGRRFYIKRLRDIDKSECARTSDGKSENDEPDQSAARRPAIRTAAT